MECGEYTLNQQVLALPEMRKDDAFACILAHFLSSCDSMSAGHFCLVYVLVRFFKVFMALRLFFDAKYMAVKLQIAENCSER